MISHPEVHSHHLQNILGQISITMDTWTSSAYDPYLAITAHYINSPPNQLNEWSLKCDLLGFAKLKLMEAIAVQTRP
jgi:hypothetical protein